MTTTSSERSMTITPHGDSRPAKRRSHLIDPHAPRPVRDPRAAAEDEARLARVKQWVASTLVVTTVLHLSVGFVFAALTVPERTNQIGLCVIAGIFGVISIAAALTIHGRSLLSPWLLLGTIPTVVGIWLINR
jgi:hypothetical protein